MPDPNHDSEGECKSCKACGGCAELDHCPKCGEHLHDEMGHCCPDHRDRESGDAMFKIMGVRAFLADAHSYIKRADRGYDLGTIDALQILNDAWLRVGPNTSWKDWRDTN